MTRSTFAAAHALSLELVGRRSVNGTADEATFGPFLAELLRRRPGLASVGIEVRTVPIPGDCLGRANVYALLRGRGRRTVLLTGHFDTVGTGDYGELEALATAPDALSRALLSHHRSDAAWIGDVASGAFLPGRGLLDMKSGLAAAIIAMEGFAARPDRAGNLLLVASPDEEDRSAGMRAAAQGDLPGLFAEWDLRPELAVNLDALADDGDGTEGQVVAFGTVGKLLLFAYVVGRETHACYPASGINAAVLAASLARAFEGSAALTDTSEPGAQPPATLLLRDLKAGYDVTTPGRAYAYWNVITYRRSAQNILDTARCLAVEATGGLVRDHAPLQVIAAADLLARVQGRTRLDEIAAIADPALDLPTQTLRLVEAAWAASGLDGPAVVLGFASTPYPSCRLGRAGRDAALREAVKRAAQETAARFGTGIATCEHLRIISDMSFLGAVDAADLAVIAASTPVWGGSLRWPLQPRPTPAIPCINAGPWGRSYHTPRERVHQRYAFEVLPALVEAIAARVLAGTAE